MNKEILDLIDEELFQDNIETELKENSIYWSDNFGAENEIISTQVAVNPPMVAWWQKNEVGKELVRIKVKPDFIINWRPPINTMGTGSLGCNFITFYLEFLILKYQDKHRERVFIIDTNNIHAEEIKTEGYSKKIRLIDNKLFIKEIPGGQITEATIQAGKIKTKIVDHSNLSLKNIQF